MIASELYTRLSMNDTERFPLKTKKIFRNGDYKDVTISKSLQIVIFILCYGK